MQLYDKCFCEFFNNSDDDGHVDFYRPPKPVSYYTPGSFQVDCILYLLHTAWGIDKLRFFLCFQIVDSP